MQQFEHAVEVGEVPVLNHDSSFALVVRNVHARAEQSLQFALGGADVRIDRLWGSRFCIHLRIAQTLHALLELLDCEALLDSGLS